MKSKPLVSVVTPSLNQAKFLEETLRSVEVQDYRPIQQIVVDGGSVDGTVDLLTKWSARDHGPGYTFDWVSEGDRGHADGLNKGFSRVQGEIVGWLNSDDVYFDRRVVSTSVAALQTHPEVDLVHGDVAMISEDSGLQMIWCLPKFDYRRVLRGYIIPQPTVFFRRCVTDKHRLDPALRVAIDHIYWLQIGREHKFLKIRRVQAGDRDHGARISRASYELMMETAKQMCRVYGAGEKPRFFSVLQDRTWKILMRLQGLLHAVSFLTQYRSGRYEPAFPVWLDSAPRLLKRQLTMRLTRRAPMGRRTARHRDFDSCGDGGSAPLPGRAARGAKG
jgi:glycosyltransferase involved in cell wall biosynthesis